MRAAAVISVPEVSHCIFPIPHLLAGRGVEAAAHAGEAATAQQVLHLVPLSHLRARHVMLLRGTGLFDTLRMLRRAALRAARHTNATQPSAAEL